MQGRKAGGNSPVEKVSREKERHHKAFHPRWKQLLTLVERHVLKGKERTGGSGRSLRARCCPQTVRRQSNAGLVLNQST